jgi:hypothetical protein
LAAAKEEEEEKTMPPGSKSSSNDGHYFSILGDEGDIIERQARETDKKRRQTHEGKPAKNPVPSKDITAPF